MTKEKIKNQKGITLISLAISILIIFIITGVIIQNTSNTIKIEELEKLKSDIDNLKGKVSNYYMEYGNIPAKVQYTNTSHINSISSAVDTGEFYVLDLSAIENLTLNYGKDYEQVKNLSSLSQSEAKQYVDLYIINEDSHNIFYVKGIRTDDDIYYTNYSSKEKDTKQIELHIK